MNNKELAVVLQPYLDEMAKADPFLAKAMEKEDKSMEECVAYIIYKVNGTKNTTTIADGNEVLALASEYFKDDTIVMPNMNKPKAEAEPKAETKPKETKKAELKPKAKSKPKAEDTFVGSLFDEL